MFAFNFHPSFQTFDESRSSAADQVFPTPFQGSKVMQ